MIDSAIAKEYLETGHCESCPIIDLHAHYGHFSGIYMPNHTPEQMISTMDRCGVEIIVSSSHTALADMVRGNAEMTAITENFMGRWYAYMVYNPNYPQAGRQELEGYDAHPTYLGLKMHPSGHEYPLTGERYKPALQFAASRRLLVLTHTWGKSEYDRPELLEEVANRYPEVIFLAGHSGHGEFEECMAVARRHPNVYLELTAAYAVRGLIERMVDEVGAHKIVFGCDLPWFDPHYAIGCIVMAHISEGARRAILRENALRLLEDRKRI
ncbi:MAG: amidohydrolase family protein [Anaerolineales bacterium]